MDYTVKIDEFDGPMDLLLHLVKQSNISIWDIRIDEITKQYLAFIKQMEEMNLNIASEYLIMASELIEMKSRSLLPLRKEEDDDFEEDPREELIQKLIDYSRYKELSHVFKDMEEERMGIHTKEPSIINEYIRPCELEEGISLEDLLGAFQKFLERKESLQPLQTKITKREYSMQERSREIKSLLKQRKEITFYDLFEFYHRDYIVVTFLSILDLAKKQELEIKQTDNFEEIYLCDKEG